jgi:hypothetical protein
VAAPSWANAESHDDAALSSLGSLTIATRETGDYSRALLDVLDAKFATAPALALAPEQAPKWKAGRPSQR